jgi:hypothetical protein
MKHRRIGRFANTTLVLSLLYGAPPVSAHHSRAEYDTNTIAEARGEVVSVTWSNPHIRLRVRAQSSAGSDQLWETESESLTRLDRAGLARDIVKVGDVVTFAGDPSRTRPQRVYLTNLLIADGREILLRANIKPRWAPDRFVDTEPRAAPTVAVAQTDSNSFLGKVFTPVRDGQAPAWIADPPLTASAPSPGPLAARPTGAR